MKFPATVLLVLALAGNGGCSTPPRGRPLDSAPRAPAGASTASASTLPSPDAPSASEGTLTAPASASAPPQAPSGAAYVGCGEPIPQARLWEETTEGEVLEAIRAAKACAAQHGRKLLLEFVAPWCEDCQEMAKLDETPLVARTLRERFERVRINVGKWDRHEALRKSFDVRALATYIVIEPKSSKVLDKTTLEPVTKKGQKLSAEAWAAWLSAH